MSLDKGRERVGIQTLVPFIPGLPVRPGGPEEPWEEKKEGMKTGKLAKDELLGVGVGVGGHTFELVTVTEHNRTFS